MLGCSTAHVCIPELARACNKCKVFTSKHTQISLREVIFKRLKCSIKREREREREIFAGVIILNLKNVPALRSFFTLVEYYLR